MHESAGHPRMLGFALTGCAWWVAGVAPTFEDFAQDYISRNTLIGFPELPDRCLLPDTLKGIFDEVLNHNMENSSGAYINTMVKFWSGLIPRIQTRKIVTWLPNQNPFKVAEGLEEMFTNAKSVIEGNPSGDREGPQRLLRASFRNSPEQLMMYLEAAENGEMDMEDLDSIVDSIEDPSPELEKMISYYWAKKVS